jgi:hypothetical protein
MTTSTKFNKVAAQVISWGILAIVFVSLFFLFQGASVHVSIH